MYCEMFCTLQRHPNHLQNFYPPNIPVQQYALSMGPQTSGGWAEGFYGNFLLFIRFPLSSP